MATGSKILEHEKLPLDDGPPPNEAELRAYYANRKMLWRNVILIILLTLGWSASFRLLNQLMLLRLSAHGVSNSTIGTLALANNWVYSILVMYFAWKSDHTRSRWGRRIPYLFISAPVIITAVLSYSYVESAAGLIALWMINCIFMDIKAATIPLLNIDCVPRHLLARVAAVSTVICSVFNFASVKYGAMLSDYSEHMPYLLCGLLLTITTLTGGLLIREPPVIPPPMKPFWPWSTMAVAWKDRKQMILMFGVALILTFTAICGQWMWVFAKNDLGLTKTDIGSAVAWSELLPIFIAIPYGWLIDRTSGYRLVFVYWMMIVATCAWLMFQTRNAGDLAAAQLMLATIAPLFGAADIMVYRNANPKYVGAVTSTCACIKGLMIGLVIWQSGKLIDHYDSNYHLAFLLGTATATLGMLLIMIYGFMSRQRPQKPGAAHEDVVLATVKEPPGADTALPAGV